MSGLNYELRECIYEILESKSPAFNLTLRQYITSYYNTYKDIPDLETLLRFFPKNTIAELVLVRDLVTFQWRTLI